MTMTTNDIYNIFNLDKQELIEYLDKLGNGEWLMFEYDNKETRIYKYENIEEYYVKTQNDGKSFNNKQSVLNYIFGGKNE